MSKLFTTLVLMIVLSVFESFADGELTVEVLDPSIGLPIPTEGGSENNAYILITNNTGNPLEIGAGVKVATDENYIVNYCYGEPLGECLEIPSSSFNSGEYFYVSPLHFLDANSTSAKGDNNKLQLILLSSDKPGQVVMDVEFYVSFSDIKAYATQIFEVGTSSIAENTLGVKFGDPYPLPAQDYVNILLSIPATKDCGYVVIDSRGREVLGGEMSAGQTLVDIQTGTLGAGVYYFVALDGDNYSAAQRFTIVR